MDSDKISSITPEVLVVIIVLGVLTLLLPRRFAIFPFILAACYITLGQQAIIATLHFSVLRILIFIGFMRILIRQEIASLKVTNIDLFFFAWVISSIVSYTILYQTVEALVNRLGLAYDACGIYFLCRVFISTMEDFQRITKLLAILAMPLALAMLFEWITGRNIFAVLGGVPQMSEIRNGRFRCQGSFRHPILAGAFGSALLPLMISLWWQNNSRPVMALLGSLSATIITITSGSSGAGVAYCSGILALGLWPMRARMKMIRRSAVILLILLHVTMKAPVWFLFARMGDLLGGSGWHRAEVIDAAITHFSEWWLIGTTYTAHWMESVNPTNPNMIDITNWFVGQGVNGGLLTLILFTAIIVVCFKEIGISLHIIDDSRIADKRVTWCIGAAIFAHIMSFISVSYFDQIVFFWYLLIASVSMIASETNFTTDTTLNKYKQLAHPFHGIGRSI